MSRQVKTPRFYVDIPSFLHAVGDIQWGHGGHSTTHQSGKNYGGAELLYLNPSNPFMRDGLHNGSANNYMFKIGQNYPYAVPRTNFPTNFCALLNHNFASEHMGVGAGYGFPYIRGRFVRLNTDSATGEVTRGISSSNIFNYSEFTNVINFNTRDQGNTKVFDPDYNGTSIATWKTATPKNWTTFELFYETGDGLGYDGTTDYSAWGNGSGYPHQLGSFVIGKYWDAPYSPDLKLSLTRRFDGIKKQKTIGGKTLANIYYDGPTEWTMNRHSADFDGEVTYKYPPFELDARSTVKEDWDDTASAHFNQRVKGGLGRKGLRSWNLTFSFLDESEMWMDYETSNTIVNDTTASQGVSPMLEDESFNFVWNCTLGGTIPFIFTDDKDSTNPDRYSICTFRRNSLSVRQVSSNVYSLSVQIDEVA
tara:strand:- start:124 stop:1386 length:1263 start_codon:yes stop_codon:yes gene_type:complete